MIGGVYNQSGGVSNFFNTLGRCVGLDYGKYLILIGQSELEAARLHLGYSIDY